MFVYRYRLHRAAVLVGALCTALFASAAAQNTSSTNHPGCRTGPDEFDSNASVNSTGKVKFQFDDDVNYIFSVTYNDTRRESTEEVRITPEVLHDINGWISMPNGTSGYICVYKFLGLNASSPEEDLNGCGGVLSEACVDKIKEMSIPINSDGSGRCPLLDVRIRELRGACGNRLTLQQSSITPMDLESYTCSVPSPQGVSIPDDYHSLPLLGYGAAPSASDSFATFDYYDLFVRQSIPWIISSTSGSASNGGSGRANTRVVCVTPDTVLPGSRIPEKKFGTWEEENSAVGSADLCFAQKLAVAVAATVGLGLAIY